YNFIPITDLFIAEPKSGIMTGRDALVSNVDPKILRENINLFFSRKFDELAQIGVRIHRTKNWDPIAAVKKSNEQNALAKIVKYNYRGLDIHYLVYDNALVEGSRLGYINLISDKNPAISVTRSVRTDHFSHALITRYPPEKCFLSIKDSSYVFPMKLGKKAMRNNIKVPKLKFQIKPEFMFYYIYGILYSSIYRERYDSQLKRHFPRIPLPNSGDHELNKKNFMRMSQIGKKLADLHLKRSDLIYISEFPVEIFGDLKIIYPCYSEEEQTIFFNKPNNRLKKITRIGGISNEMWQYEIGSICQLERWLKARVFISPDIDKNKNNTKNNTKDNTKNNNSSKRSPKKSKRHIGLRRPLTSEELKDFLELCAIIKNTIEIVPELDIIYEKIDQY
ncbi:MAG: type ISP restriction/modification enzyme, partial [Promethearchaeota archaeon]